MRDNILNKKAQIGETATWIVATVIIFVILFFSIYFSSLLAKATKVPSFNDEVSFYNPSLLSALLLQEEGQTVFHNLAEGKNVDKNTAKIENILKKIYTDNQTNPILGIYSYNPWAIGSADGNLIYKIKINKGESLYLSKESLF